MKGKEKSKIYNFAPLLSILCILLLWSVCAVSVDSEYILPSIGSTFKSFLSLFSFSEFYLSLLGTLLRTIISFVCSFIIAFVLAVLSKKFTLAEKFIAPLIMITRVLPTVAVVLLLLFWTTNNVAPVIVTMLVVLPTTFTGIKNTLSTVDEKQLEMCKVFNVPNKTVLFKVILPQILPELFLLIGSGLSLNLKLMVASEVLSQTANSMGYLLNTSKVYFEISTMIALVVVTIILGLIIEFIFNGIAKKVGKWK